MIQDGGRNGVAERGEENEEMLDATGCWHLEGFAVWDATWPEGNAEWAGKEAEGSGRRMRAHCTRMKGFWGRQWGGAPADGDGRIRIMVKRFHLQLGAVNQLVACLVKTIPPAKAALPVHSAL